MKDTTEVKRLTLNEIVVSANKTEETKKTVPQQIMVITNRQIELLQPQSTADLLENSGGVFVQKSQFGGGSPNIRGFEANRILLVVDGVRMNNIIYRSGHLQNVITLDHAILDRAEVLYGPNSTVYGSDALGGVIHFYTRDPAFHQGNSGKINVNASSRYSTVNNELAEHLDVNYGNKNFASLTSVTYSKFDDLKGGESKNPFYEEWYGERNYYQDRINGKDSLVKNSNKFLQAESGFSQYDILQKFAFRQNSRITHKLNFQFSNSTDIPRYDRLTDPSGKGLKYAEWYYGPQKRLMGAYDFDYSNYMAWFQMIHAGINAQDIEESRHTRKFGKNNLQHRNEHVNVLGLNLDVKRISGNHQLRLGLDGQYNTLESTAHEDDIVTGISRKIDTRYPDGDNTMTNIALYFSHTWKINPVFTLTDGVRFGYITVHSTFVDTSFFHLPYTKADQNNLVYSGSLGMIYSPKDDLKVSMLVSTGFRAPDVDDVSKVFESVGGSLVVPNPDLKPEKTVNVEMGLTKVFAGKLKWEAAVYYTRFFDMIVKDVFTFNGHDSILYQGVMSQVLANQNEGKAYLAGFNSGIIYSCSEKLSLGLTAGYTYGRIVSEEKDIPMNNIPPFMLKFETRYQSKSFSGLFFVNFNGWKSLKDYYLNSEDNEQYATAKGMPAWMTLNLHLGWTFSKVLKVQGGVDNILDTQYRTFGSGINGPGRNIFAGVKVSI